MEKEIALFAGGCFWCIEADFVKMPTVLDVESGYTGGEEKNPTYEEVVAHKTGHREVVRVVFDPSVTTYRELVEYFFKKHDPTDAGGSFYDRGFQYSPAIYYTSEEQKKAAEEVKREVEESGRYDKPIVTEILPATEFYPAEEYHQRYSEKNPEHYNRYRRASGRDEFLENHN